MYKVIKGAFLKKGYSGMLTKLNLKKDRLKDISDALDSADLNNDNMVDWEEWRADLKLRGVPDAEIEAVFAKYDTDGDMVLNPEERKKLQQDLLKQTQNIDNEIEDVKGRQEVGEQLGYEIDTPQGFSQEQTPVSNELLMEKLNKMFVTGEEFNVLSRRVDRIEHHIAKIGSKIDAIVSKLDLMDRQKQRENNVRDNLFNSLAQGPK